jgi:Fe2+ or Zn2+ uptake regulation protein
MEKKGEQSTLVGLFGEKPFIKIVDTLLDHPTYEYTKTELAEVNDISRSTLYRVWDKLEELEIVKPTKKVGSTRLYKLNPDSEVAEQLHNLEQNLSVEDLGIDLKSGRREKSDKNDRELAA